MIVAREKAEYYGLPETPAPKRRIRRRPAGQVLLRKDRVALAGMVVLMFCCCAVIVFYYAQVLATGYKMNQVEEELALMRTESHDLYTKINQFSSLEYIEALAVNELGMVRPQNNQMVMVETVGAGTLSSTETSDGGATARERQENAAEHRGQNWVIKAFTDMVGRLESSIHTG